MPYIVKIVANESDGEGGFVSRTYRNVLSLTTTPERLICLDFGGGCCDLYNIDHLRSYHVMEQAETKVLAPYGTDAKIINFLDTRSSHRT